MKKRDVSPDSNSYYTPDDPLSVLRQMRDIHRIAIRVMETSDIIEVDNGVIRLKSDNIPSEVKSKVKNDLNDGDNVVSFLVNLVSQIPRVGEGSLKARTGLMEYRYDPS